MATSVVSLSLHDYLRTRYRPDVHFIEGQIEERHVGEFEHGTIQTAIGSFFWTRRKDWNIHPVTEQRIQVAENRVRIVDVAILRGDVPREVVTRTPPLICIEILSPEDRMNRAKLVLADYVSMGVPNVWLIDPLRRAAFTFDAEGLHDADPYRLTVAGTPVLLDLSEAFAAID